MDWMRPGVGVETLARKEKWDGWWVMVGCCVGSERGDDVLGLLAIIKNIKLVGYDLREGVVSV